VPLVSSSPRQSRARRQRALLHALRLPLLRARQTQAGCQSACREIAGYGTLSRYTCGIRVVALPLPAHPMCPAASAVGGPRPYRSGKEIKRAAGRRPLLLSRPFTGHWEGLVVLVGVEVCVHGIGFVAGMLSPLVPVWDATFEEKGLRMSAGWFAAACNYRPSCGAWLSPASFGERTRREAVMRDARGQKS
jgi:hypothetical protein